MSTVFSLSGLVFLRSSQNAFRTFYINMTCRLGFHKLNPIQTFREILLPSRRLSSIKPNRLLQRLEHYKYSTAQNSVFSPRLQANKKIMSKPLANNSCIEKASRSEAFHINNDPDCEYSQAIKDLNDLQSNNQVLALAKYKKPETILPLFGKQLELAGIKVEELDRLNAVHISGTKGKGSTCAFLEGILLSSPARNGKDIKVGSYNSPHLIHVTERIRINSAPINRSLFTKYFREVYDKLKKATKREEVPMPSYFAFLTILAFHIFLKEQVDIAIIEVGIGGEFDPTNIIQKPSACAITTLDLDHTNILGNSIKEIAWTKAGIVKTGVPMFTIRHEQEAAAEMIEERARRKGSPVYICEPLKGMLNESGLGIQGPAQTTNASLACQLASYLSHHLKLPLQELETAYPVSGSASFGTSFQELPGAYRTGLARSNLAGRCQIVETSRGFFFLDGAHTNKSMINCLDWFIRASRELDQNAFKVLMVNVIGERNKKEVMRPLVTRYRLFDRIVFTSNQTVPTTKQLTDDSLETFARPADVNHEKGFENVKNNERVWLELVHESGLANDSLPQVIVKPNIFESIESLTESDQETASTLGNYSTGSIIRKPHILATGSLHFVGAILDTIQKSYLNR